MYTTIADADTYFTTRLNSDAWDDATDAEQTAALTMASKAIDQLNFAGDVTDSDQEHQFPRGGDEEIPQDVKDACCELALSLLDGVDPELEYENLSMVSQSFGTVKSTYDRTNRPSHIVAGIVSIVAWRLLLPYLRDPLTLEVTRVS